MIFDHSPSPQLNHPKWRTLFIGLWFAVAATACVAADTGTPSLPSTAASPTGTSAPAPTSTPLAPKLLLVSAEEDRRNLMPSLMDEIESFVAAENWELEIVNQLAEGKITENLRLVIALEAPPELADFAAGHPDIQFIAIGFQGLDPLPNLSMIGPDGFRNDQVAFAAGYLAAVITIDWRVGLLSTNDQSSPSNDIESFRNGVIYFCGLCRQTYPPFYEYPTVVSIDFPPSINSWQTLADDLIRTYVKTVFIDIVNPDGEFFQQATENGMVFIGGPSTIPLDDEHWVASFRWRPDLALRENWARVLQNQGGWSADIPLQIEQINPNLLSQGRLQWVERMLEDLISGYIDPHP
jgi:hypothetical protein